MSFQCIPQGDGTGEDHVCSRHTQRDLGREFDGRERGVQRSLGRNGLRYNHEENTHRKGHDQNPAIFQTSPSVFLSNSQSGVPLYILHGV